MKVIGDLRRMSLGGVGEDAGVEFIWVGLDDELAFDLEGGDLAVDVDLPLVVLV